MGGCASAPPSSKEQAETNQKINRDLETERKKAANEIKLLLLGAGESGKTTIAKQMKIIHLSGFPKEERLSYKSIIYNNTVSSMRVLITAAKELGIALQPQNNEIAEKVLALEEYFSDNINSEVAGFIKTLWADPGVQEVYGRQAEFQLNDSAKYFFQEIDRLATADYIPTEADVIRCRAKTTGIIETEFDVEKTHFRMVDVGGQRSERKKWMHCFQDVTAVMFCVAMSEYDLKLYEDDATNRMQESLKLFKEICNNRWFVETSMILFLNKRDVFEEKIQKVDLNVCFTEYTGGKVYEAASAFVREQFVAQNTNTKKQIYPHLTCATDTGNVQNVFNNVRSTLLKKGMDDAGLEM